MSEIQLDEKQQEAVDLIQHAKICCITGGAGVGKTSCLKQALTQLNDYALCAPTGKAARRMKEATGRDATTIHRLLQWTPQGFMYGPGMNQELLETDVVITDEASMIDVKLAADLLSALGRHTRIAFVGDANQLPPVGPGAVFRDMIASGKVPTVKLEKLYRAAQESWVCRNAPKVLEGGPIETEDISDFMWYQIGSDDQDHVGDVILQIIEEHKLGLHGMQILSPMKIRSGGSIALNNQLQPVLNAKGMKQTAWRLHEDCTLHPGDKVMQMKNDYMLGRFNGETGTVASVDKFELVVKYDTEYTKYTREQAYNLQLAYACTVHKFQGSQEQDVIVVCHSSQSRMLTRQLFYTAITRAQKRVFLVGDQKGLDMALTTRKDEVRRTKLVPRLQGVL